MKVAAFQFKASTIIRGMGIVAILFVSIVVIYSSALMGQADESDGSFIIRDSVREYITVTSPNGGESLVEGLGCILTWTDNISENVKIELYKGANLYQVIADSTPSDGSYPWDVPISITGEDFRIKISSTSNASIYDFSNDYFAITAARFITVTDPNGGESWQFRTTHNITWDSERSGNVNIAYSTDGGSNWTTIVSSTADDGTHSWNVPNTPSTNCYVRVMDSNSTLHDISNDNFTITSDCTLPEWTVSPGAYEYTMTLVGIIVFDGVESMDPNDIIASYVGDECRGVAQPTLFPDTGRHTFGMTIYSNAAIGEIIHFEAFDHSECVIMNSTTFELAFESNARSGSDENPTVVEFEVVNSTTVQRIELSEGWNWISVNVKTDDMDPNLVLASIAPNGDFIKNQTSFASYYGGTTGWYSSNGLDVIDPKSLYMLQMDTDDVLEFKGTPVDINTVIPVNLGWNWIGYLPQDGNAINAALASIEPNGNFIKNQSSFATYYGGTIGWYSSNGLDNMIPGDGYMLKMNVADELIYGIPEGAIAKNSPGKISVPAWALDIYKYEHSMAITGVILDNEIESRNTNLIIGAFADDECRGLASLAPFPLNGRYEFGLLVYGDKDEKVCFKIYDQQTGSIIHTDNSVIFEVDGILGNGENPYAVQMSSSTIVEIPMNYCLYQNYPNPFNQTTTMAYDLPEEGDVQLEIYDIRGHLVKRLQQSEKTAGHYEVLWDGCNELAVPVVSGLYFYKLNSKKFSAIKKMVLAK